MAKIFVCGAGTFGTALATLTANQGHDVTLWAYLEQERDQLLQTRENPLLKGVHIPEGVQITHEMEPAADCELLIIATPSFGVRAACRNLAKVLRRDTVVACVSKGLEESTLKTMSDIIEEEIPDNRCVIVSGPSHAEEIAAGVPTTVVAASRSRQAAEYVQNLLTFQNLRVYVSDDILGVELGGALKNVIALAAGITDGIGTGDNAKAALMTRGITEIARLGVAMGGKSETFAGLSGIGDLIVTCTSMHSRNRRAGILIGQGVPAQEAIRQIGMTVEGYTCTKCAYELARRMKVEMPIVEQMYQVLYQGKDPKQAMQDLMTRPKRHESEVIWLLTRS